MTPEPIRLGLNQPILPKLLNKILDLRADCETAQIRDALTCSRPRHRFRWRS
ncbi:hypothetical protein CHELA40_10443 [Chelatococcus asaccharovorans]|nr:hypothetical protein CHELA40_10443 [Chelatococcus asaccharovorans]CAH1686687.1 hypothetical protein CHELA17_65164 [Chelatococcus asaccharovorans]